MVLKVGGMRQRNTYEGNIYLEHRFAEQIKMILGRQFIIQDPVLDRQEGTDFAICILSPIRVACRLRRYEYYLKYPDDFTIRWSLPSGQPTEIDKIRRGFVNYLLYGFVDRQEAKIISYFIATLEKYRTWPNPKWIKVNNPPDSKLAIYSLTQFPPSFVIKRWP
jgi:hypothetical protein